MASNNGANCPVRVDDDTDPEAVPSSATPNPIPMSTSTPSPSPQQPINQLADTTVYDEDDGTPGSDQSDMDDTASFSEISDMSGAFYVNSDVFQPPDLKPPSSPQSIDNTSVDGNFSSDSDENDDDDSHPILQYHLAPPSSLSDWEQDSDYELYDAEFNYYSDDSAELDSNGDPNLWY